MVQEENGTWREMMTAPTGSVMNTMTSIGDSVVPQVIEHVQQQKKDEEEAKKLEKLAPKPVDDF